jgi:HNH endonuclease
MKLPMLAWVAKGQKINGTVLKEKIISPCKLFRYGLQLTGDGLLIFLENYWLKGLTDNSYKKLFDFHLEHESLIHILCYHSKMSPELYYGADIEPISTFKLHYEYMLKEKLFDNHFGSEIWTYPVSPGSLREIAYRFACFFPVYDSYLQIAMGNTDRFSELISKLNKWERETDKIENALDDKSAIEAPVSEEILSRAKEAAEQRIKVMPAMRWRVFQRDGWKCVACGRTSEDDVILHVDHIVPRSKGGKDELDNYQTLCHPCNIGKSNKDETDLRRSKVARSIPNHM